MFFLMFLLIMLTSYVIANFKDLEENMRTGYIAVVIAIVLGYITLGVLFG